MKNDSKLFKQVSKLSHASQQTRTTKKYNYFHLSDIIQLQPQQVAHINQTHAWINVKKLLGLQYIHETFDYTYIIVCDAEIKIIPKYMDHMKALEEVCDRGEILGTELHGDTPIVQKINRSSMNMLPQEWLPKLLDITNNARYLAWFSNLPIYESRYLTEFFHTLGKDYIDRLIYYSFDHVVYYLFCLYKGYWGAKRIEDYGHSVGLECTYQANVYQDIASKFPLLWVSYRIYSKIPEFIESTADKSFIVFHRDRT